MASLTHGHEFEQPLGNSEGQGSLACCSPSGHIELDLERLNKSYRIITWISQNNLHFSGQEFAGAHSPVGSDNACRFQHFVERI